MELNNSITYVSCSRSTCASDGVAYGENKVEETRRRYVGLKAELQRVETKRAKRHLRKVSGREARFKRYTNHLILRQIVSVAKGTKRARVGETKRF